jgi:hypothetical protein
LEVSCQLHSPAALYPRKEHHVTIGWVWPRIALDYARKRQILLLSGF